MIREWLALKGKDWAPWQTASGWLIRAPRGGRWLVPADGVAAAAAADGDFLGSHRRRSTSGL